MVYTVECSAVKRTKERFYTILGLILPKRLQEVIEQSHIISLANISLVGHQKGVCVEGHATASVRKGLEFVAELSNGRSTLPEGPRSTPTELELVRRDEGAALLLEGLPAVHG